MNTGVHVIPTLFIGVWLLGLFAWIIVAAVLAFGWSTLREVLGVALGIALLLGGTGLLLAFLYYSGAID